jgi:hypothetical protein
MKARALRHGDVQIDGAVRALFDGQIYDLPDALVKEHDWLEAVEETRAKAVEGPPQDKAVRPQRNKGL